MNYFEKSLMNTIGEKRLKKIQKVKIGIAGAGGLGSNCAFNLVRSGFKNFKIVDFDIIDYSNLNRQFFYYNQVGLPKVKALKENLMQINPDVNIEDSQIKLNKDNMDLIFNDCDVVVEAFDKAIYKKMIVETYINSKKLIVSASGLGGWGNSDEIKVHKIKDNFYIVGDLITEVGEKTPPISPRVNITAAKQADIILEYILRKDENFG
ncbi:sulfur carrier protein ThiS adenylyltransferase ThiF [Defluviitalea phaphyphila]|uniref:sulfur carrier protein ThiS adenylyltransferase ThiF n=1 Tax=Defluviitalea phaphyphila TaxID=1473580 RepID=UPI00072FFDDB|nr:sulfur carrier protein ThiS adenylyltransferase ThiF [Defluviitalea phaphyphila]